MYDQMALPTSVLPCESCLGKGKKTEMKKLEKFDYDKFEKLQNEAKARSNRVNLDKFDRKTKKSRFN